MSNGFTFTVPGPQPALNSAYKIVSIKGASRLAKHEKVEAWQVEVAYRTREARPSGWLPGRRVVIEIEWWFPRKGRDSDGPLKFLRDGIATGLGCDDQGFLTRDRLVEVDRANPRTVVQIANEDSI